MADTGKIIGLIEALGGGGGSGGGVSATVIADAFSSSKAYNAGEYVTRSDKLYVFTADHAAGAWTGTDADEVTVGEELTDVKSALGPATGSTFGTVKVFGGYGITMIDGMLACLGAVTSVIKAGDDAVKPIVVNHAHEAAFYGLAKAAGDTTQKASANAVGTYTESAKEAICRMLGVPYWKTAELSASDYDADIGGFLFDVGDGKEIDEIRIIGQCSYDADNTETADIGVGFGNSAFSQYYNTVSNVSYSMSGKRKLAVSAYAHSLKFNSSYSQQGYATFGYSANTTHAWDEYIATQPSNVLNRATGTWGNLSNPRYFHYHVPATPDWAYIYIEYTLR